VLELIEQFRVVAERPSKGTPRQSSWIGKWQPSAVVAIDQAKKWITRHEDLVGVVIQRRTLRVIEEEEDDDLTMKAWKGTFPARTGRGSGPRIPSSRTRSTR
jgi:hypothetical protein